jgi:hypothetical protein
MDLLPDAANNIQKLQVSTGWTCIYLYGHKWTQNGQYVQWNMGNKDTLGTLARSVPNSEASPLGH